MCHQNSCRFYNCIAYDRDYSGLSQDDEEGMRIGRQLGDKSVLFMCNHGVLVVAETAAKAFDDIYYLERACMTQVRCWLICAQERTGRAVTSPSRAPGSFSRPYCLR